MSADQIPDQSPVSDPNGYEEDSDYALRQHLGLRPIYYPDPTGGEHLHPDRRPCPPWCAMGQLGYEHEIDPKSIMTAEHRTDAICAHASLYKGDSDRREGTHSATWETSMSGYGEATYPKITVYLRHYEGKDQRFAERMRLTINDAQDLVAVLQHLIGQADAARLLNEAQARNAFQLGVDAGAYGLAAPTVPFEEARATPARPADGV